MLILTVPLIIFFILPSIVKMAPDLNTKLEMCNFLANKAVYGHEQYNAVANAGKMLKTPNVIQNNTELDRCLANLRAKTSPGNHINFKFLLYDKETVEQSREYARQMEQLERYLLNGRELVNGFVMVERLKYSPNYFGRLLEDYLRNGNSHIVDVNVAIEPEEWPAYLPPNGGQTVVGSKRVGLTELFKHNPPSGAAPSTLYSGWVKEQNGRGRQLSAILHLIKKGHELGNVTFVINDEHRMDVEAMQPIVNALLNMLP